MDTKEFQYNDVVINGFVALFINLAILPLLVVMSFLLFKGSIVLPGQWYSSESTRVRLRKPVSSG